jgi:hypothetical protein
VFALAIREASCHVSRVQRGTDRPQNRHDGAAFACRSLLRCRSCRLLGAFLLAPLPPMRQRRAHQEGPCAPQVFPRVIALTDPSATRASSVDFPGAPGRRLPWLRRLHGGRRRASPVASHGLVIGRALPPRRSALPRQPDGDKPCGLHLAGGRFGLRGCALSGPPVRARALRPDDSPPSWRWGCREASEGWFPVPLRSKRQSFWLLLWEVSLLLHTPAFAGRTTGREGFPASGSSPEPVERRRTSALAEIVPWAPKALPCHRGVGERPMSLSSLRVQGWLRWAAGPCSGTIHRLTSPAVRTFPGCSPVRTTRTSAPCRVGYARLYGPLRPLTGRRALCPLRPPS